MLFGFDVDSAFAEMNALTRQVNSLLGNRGLDGRKDDDGVLIWTADLPGVDRSDVKVTVENGRLTIDAKREPTVPEGRTVRYGERRGFEVHRSIELPDTVDPESIAASFEHGVLTLRLPRRPETRPRTVEVQVG
jgi:HSP20 family protein